jgi:hypothetical protein
LSAAFSALSSVMVCLSQATRSTRPLAVGRATRNSSIGSRESAIVKNIESGHVIGER